MQPSNSNNESSIQRYYRKKRRLLEEADQLQYELAEEPQEPGETEEEKQGRIQQLAQLDQKRLKIQETILQNQTNPMKFEIFIPFNKEPRSMPEDNVMPHTIDTSTIIIGGKTAEDLIQEEAREYKMEKFLSDRAEANHGERSINQIRYAIGKGKQKQIEKEQQRSLKEDFRDQTLYPIETHGLDVDPMTIYPDPYEYLKEARIETKEAQSLRRKIEGIDKYYQQWRQKRALDQAMAGHEIEYDEELFKQLSKRENRLNKKWSEYGIGVESLNQQFYEQQTERAKRNFKQIVQQVKLLDDQSEIESEKDAIWKMMITSDQWTTDKPLLKQMDIFRVKTESLIQGVFNIQHPQKFQMCVAICASILTRTIGSRYQEIKYMKSIKRNENEVISIIERWFTFLTLMSHIKQPPGVQPPEYLTDLKIEFNKNGYNKLAWRWNNPLSLYHIYERMKEIIDNFENIEENEADENQMTDAIEAIGGNDQIEEINPSIINSIEQNLIEQQRDQLINPNNITTIINHSLAPSFRIMDDEELKMDVSENQEVNSAMATGQKIKGKITKNVLLNYKKALEMRNQQRDKVTPDIINRGRNWDPYKEYKVSSRRGVKVKAKEEWANRVAKHFIEKQYIGDNADKKKADWCYKKGWLVEEHLKKFSTQYKRVIELSATNTALAQAYKRFNYSQYKYVKKSWISHCIGLQQIAGPGYPDLPATAKEMIAKIQQTIIKSQAIQPFGIDMKQTGAYSGNNFESFYTLLTNTFTYKITPKAAVDPNSTDPRDRYKKFEFDLEEQLTSMVTDSKNSAFFCGCTRLDTAYLSNKSVLNKLSFSISRGYKCKAFKYGLSVTNNQFSTMYVCIIPAHESKTFYKPIFVIPEGQRLNIGSQEVDFDDYILIFGIYSINAAGLRQIKEENDIDVLAMNPTLACELSLQYGGLFECSDGDVQKFDEAKILYKPSMSKYMLKKNTARIGAIAAKNGKAIVLADHTYYTQDIQGFETDMTQPVWKVGKKTLMDIAEDIGRVLDSREFTHPSDFYALRDAFKDGETELTFYEFGTLNEADQGKLRGIAKRWRMAPTLDSFKIKVVPKLLPYLTRDQIVVLSVLKYGESAIETQGGDSWLRVSEKRGLM